MGCWKNDGFLPVLRSGAPQGKKRALRSLEDFSPAALTVMAIGRFATLGYCLGITSACGLEENGERHAA